MRFVVKRAHVLMSIRNKSRNQPTVCIEPIKPCASLKSSGNLWALNNRKTRKIRITRAIITNFEYWPPLFSSLLLPTPIALNTRPPTRSRTPRDTTTKSKMFHFLSSLKKKLQRYTASRTTSSKTKKARKRVEIGSQIHSSGWSAWKPKTNVFKMIAKITGFSICTSSFFKHLSCTSTWFSSSSSLTSSSICCIGWYSGEATAYLPLLMRTPSTPGPLPRSSRAPQKGDLFDGPVVSLAATQPTAPRPCSPAPAAPGAGPA
mmetsp:Transcript_100598/g.224825  ORF Transcript_100598/g.224825 Transcript_100598/m.224825 type:complete len:261 (+) Transcript_100598:876-1658(+)